MAKPTKSRKMGRPKLPPGQAKGRIVPVRFSAEEAARISGQASANNLNLSEWIRRTINAAIA